MIAPISIARPMFTTPAPIVGPEFGGDVPGCVYPRRDPTDWTNPSGCWDARPVGVALLSTPRPFEPVPSVFEPTPVGYAPISSVYEPTPPVVPPLKITLPDPDSPIQ